MTAEPTGLEQTKHVEIENHGGSSGTVYFFGLIGACVYYLKGATTLQERAKAVLKGIAWPAFLVYDLLTFLHR